jgi:hypothetical protein
VKVGASLKSLDELKVSENSYVGLIHATGKPLEVKSAGKYKVADLSAKVGGGASVLNKYTDFILSSATTKKNQLSATGAVTRGLDRVRIFLPPSSSNVYGDTVRVEWEKDKTISAPYIVTVSTLFGEELLTVETSANSIPIYLNDKTFAKENDIMIKVSSKKDKKDSQEHTLRKFPKAEKEKITAVYKDVAAQTASKTALNSLVKAAFFEQHKLLADASTAYQQAIQLEPGVPMYQEAYDAFLLRNALKPAPKK